MTHNNDSRADSGPSVAPGATVAIVGRPNVGKSTLYNRLVGRRQALVHDTPGLTRDRKEGTARLGALRFTVIDTAGLEDAKEGVVEARMVLQTMKAVDSADLVLMVFDVRSGITAVDELFARELRRRGVPVILLANKCEGREAEMGLSEAYRLGLGDPVALSAEHGQGMGVLEEAMAAAFEHAGMAAHVRAPKHDRRGGARRGRGDTQYQIGVDADEDFDFAALEARASGEISDETPDVLMPDAPDRPITLAIAGRPNAGKSTLMNKLLGDDRVMTGPEPGLTRDAITMDWSYAGRAFKLVDTAGLRRRAKVENVLEKLSVMDTFRAIRFADVVVLMIDAQTIQEFGRGIDRQDLTIARQVVEEGRALVVVANKWDLIEEPNKTRGEIINGLARSFAQLKDVPLITLSALEGGRIDRLMTAITKSYDAWNMRISTGRLNRWLEAMTEEHPPPLASGRRIRIRYMTQAKARPPTFVLFVSKPKGLPESYIRYLANGLRKSFDFAGVPLRLQLRSGRNPYVDKGNKSGR